MKKETEILCCIKKLYMSNHDNIISNNTHKLKSLTNIFDKKNQIYFHRFMQ